MSQAKQASEQDAVAKAFESAAVLRERLTFGRLSGGFDHSRSKGSQDVGTLSRILCNVNLSESTAGACVDLHWLMKFLVAVELRKQDLSQSQGHPSPRDSDLVMQVIE